MIAKGNLHGDGAKLAAYLTTGKDGERAELIELRGFPTGNIHNAFAAAQLGAEATTNSTRPFFHCYVRLLEGESLSREQWQYVADRIEKQLGFDGQPRALAFHHLPDGATHLHIAWSRHDLDQDRAIDPGLYKLKLKEISRQLEQKLGLTRVRNERDPEQKTLAPNRNEFEQARRLGTDLKAIRESIRDCWDRSDNGAAFTAALDEQGFVLARGDKRDFVVIDPAGGDHALGKRITGVAAPGIRAKLADIDRAQLPSVDQAKELQAERAHLAALRELPSMVPGLGDGIPVGARLTSEPAAPQKIDLEAVQALERSDAPTPGLEATAAITAPQNAPEPRIEVAADKALGRAGNLIAGGIEALGKIADRLADMFAPAPPPTVEQQQRDGEANAERAARHMARQHDDDEEFRQRLEQQLRDDLARAQRDRDDDYRGRQRER